MSGPLSPLTKAEAVEAIESTITAILHDLYEPRLTTLVEEQVEQKLHRHVRYILNQDGLLFPVRRVWKWRTWELTLGRRARPYR